MFKYLFIAGATVLLASSLAVAAPTGASLPNSIPQGNTVLPAATSACAVNTQGGGFTCNVFEDNPETSNVITLPNGVTAGYVVLLEHAGDQNNRNNWSDVAWFKDNGNGIATTLTFLSDTGSLPSLATVLASPNAFILEVQQGTGNDNTDMTLYNASPNTYHFFSGAPVNEGVEPEPASMALLGSGLAALALIARKRVK
jgi:hypothetical protein